MLKGKQNYFCSRVLYSLRTVRNVSTEGRNRTYKDRGYELPTEARRVSRRALEKRDREKLVNTQRKSKLQDREVSKQAPKSPLFAKTPQDLWVKPQKAKFEVPQVPESQKDNFRYRQSPVMKIRDLALGGKAEEALEIFKTEICNYHKDRIDEFTYNQLLLACSRSAKWKLSFKIYNDMKKRSVKPTIVTITNLLNCLAAVTYPTPEEKIKLTKEKVRYVIGEMEKHGIEPNTQSYNVMLKVLGSISDLSGALKLVNEMNINPNVEVDITTYTLLVDIFGTENLEGVFSVWDDLKERDIVATLQFYHAVMKYCNIHKRADLAIEISLQILEDKLNWDHRTVSILCTSYALLGQSSYAGVLLKKVDENSIPMDSVMWNSILRLGTMKAWGLARGVKWMSDIQSAEQLINEMEKRLLASKAAPSTITKTIDLVKTEEIEALLFGSLNSALPEHTKKYYSALLKRNKGYKFTDHYQSKYDKLFTRNSDSNEQEHKQTQ